MDLEHDNVLGKVIFYIRGTLNAGSKKCKKCGVLVHLDLRIRAANISSQIV